MTLEETVQAAMQCYGFGLMFGFFICSIIMLIGIVINFILRLLKKA